MNCLGKSACLTLALAGIVGAAAADEDQARAGREVLDQRCGNCHGGTAPAAYPIMHRAQLESLSPNPLDALLLPDPIPLWHHPPFDTAPSSVI